MIWKLLKVFVIAAVIVSIALALSYMYYSRDRYIDLTKVLPQELVVCNKTIKLGDPEYAALYDWLQVHKEPWKNTPTSYVPQYVYSGKNFHFSVHPSGVVANVLDIEGWTQVTIDASTSTIDGECE